MLRNIFYELILGAELLQLTPPQRIPTCAFYFTNIYLYPSILGPKALVLLFVCSV